MKEIKLGDTFDSFMEWKSTFEEFCKATDQGFKVYTSKSVKSHNKKLVQSRLKTKSKLPPADTVDEKWQFAHVSYCCSLSKGKSKARDDVNGKVMYKPCKAVVAIKYTKQIDKLQIIKMNLEHNHSDTPDPPVDSAPDISMDAPAHMHDLEADPEPDVGNDGGNDAGNEASHEIANPIVHDTVNDVAAAAVAIRDADTTGSSESDEDHQDPATTLAMMPSEGYRALNVQHARMLPLSLGVFDPTGADEMPALLADLEKLEAADSDAVVSVIVSDSDAVTAVFFQTGPMRRSFRQFPEVLLLDTGYPLAMGGGSRFSLMSLSGHDASGLGCPFAFAVLMRPVRLVVGLLLSVFASANRAAAARVRVLLLGKDQLKLPGVSSYFERATTTMLCHYHVIRSLLDKMDRMKLAPAEQERACRTLRAMLACLHERTYMDNLRRLEVMDARFGRYFRRVWHAQKELWAGFRRNGIVPWCAGVNDRVEALVQFLQAVCSQSRSLCEAVCNLAYGAHGVLAQTSTVAMLEEIREYHVQLLPFEARLISACCDYAAVHLLVQVRISRSHKFTVVVSGNAHQVSSIAGRGSVPLTGFACNCAFREAYGLPCCHALVVAHARGIEVPLDAVEQRWRRCGPFPVDLSSGEEAGGEEEEESAQGQVEYQERLRRVQDLSEQLCSLVAISPPEEFASMCTLLEELQRTWARNATARIRVSPLHNANKGMVTTKEELMDAMDDFDLSHKDTSDMGTGLDNSHAVLSDDDADMARDGVKSNVFAGTELEKSRSEEDQPCPQHPLVNIKMPDDAVFGFSGGIFKEESGTAGGHAVATAGGAGESSTAAACAAASGETASKLEEDVYGINSTDLSCFPAAEEARQLGDLFGYAAGEEGRDSPVLLSIKDDELSDGSKEVARIKWDNEESYKLLDSIMEAESSEKLDCVPDEMMASSGHGEHLQEGMEEASSLLADMKDGTGLGADAAE